MKTVNPYFLHEFLGPLTGLADDDDAVIRYRTLDSNNAEQVREIIRQEIAPSFAQENHQMQARSKLSLSYYLSKPGSRFDRVFNSCMPPFDHPTDARQFFLWLWEELFPGESFIISDLGEYREVQDIYEPNRIAAVEKARRSKTIPNEG